MRRAAVLVALMIAGCKDPPAQASSTTPTAPPEESAPPAPLDAAPPPPAPSFTPRVAERAACAQIGRPGGFAQFLSLRDRTTSFVDGDDLLALVNRSPLGALPADYAPSDMVDLHGGAPVTARECEQKYGACLRKDAADALHGMLDAMKAAGFAGRIESAYRSYGSQCGTFVRWATKTKDSTFCDAAEQSALPGHSQHQLGTTIDLFTEAWFAEGEKRDAGGSFRDGFGCTQAGLWIAEHSWEHGFVLPYPIHPDDRTGNQGCLARWDVAVPANPRTGYRNEPWHLRFVGKDAAARFHEAWKESGPGTPDELTLEQWLRARLGLNSDADLPVCDGCACDACSTLAPDVAARLGVDAGAKAPPEPCRDGALWLDENGHPVAAGEEPRLLDARVVPWKGEPHGAIAIDVKVHAAPHTVTQPPVLGAHGPFYVQDATFAKLVPYGRGAHHYDDLPGAWRVAVEPSPRGEVAWPWRGSIARPRLARAFNRANLYLAAAPGDATVRVVFVPPAGTTKVRVTLLRDGEEHDTREIGLE